MKKIPSLLIFIIVVGAFLRFTNLMWGNGYFFHPDENNMARSISQMSPERGFHPDFFAYGQFPLYLSYFSAQAMYGVQYLFESSSITSSISLPPINEAGYSINQVLYSNGIFWLRFWSAFFSTCTIAVVFYLTKTLTQNSHQNKINEHMHHSFIESAKTNFAPYAASIFTAFMPGLIQSAHFGTTEAIMTFFFVLTLLLTFNGASVLIIGMIIGLAIGTKITGVFYLATPLMYLWITKESHDKDITAQIRKKVFYTIALLSTSGLFFFLSSPYSLLDWEHFRGTSQYETEVAIGKAHVFYTRQFANTKPLMFQFQNIFPYTAGSILTIFTFISIGVIFIILVKSKNWDMLKKYFLLIFSFITILLFNSFLFAKWTRFVTPIIPIFAVISALSMFYIAVTIHKWKKVLYTIFGGIVLISILEGVSFFSIYAKDDSRKMASTWIYNHISEGSYILSETGNVVDIPLDLTIPTTKEVIAPHTKQYKVVSFDFYHLDLEKMLPEKLVDHLIQADYIFVPSRRIFINHMKLPDIYPITNRYYETLFGGQLGFIEVATIASYPQLLGLPFPDEEAEETWTVFDHPVIRIYKKIAHKTSTEYLDLLTLKVHY